MACSVLFFPFLKKAPSQPSAQPAPRGEPQHGPFGRDNGAIMVITDFLEKNARLAGEEVALVEINPSEERDNAVTWRDFSLIENTRPDLPYRREMTWAQFDTTANRFANLLLSRGMKRGTKVGILLMNCLE